MKIKKSQLKQIIQEEIEDILLNEAKIPDPPPMPGWLRRMLGLGDEAVPSPGRVGRRAASTLPTGASTESAADVLQRTQSDTEAHLARLEGETTGARTRAERLADINRELDIATGRDASGATTTETLPALARQQQTDLAISDPRTHAERLADMKKQLDMAVGRSEFGPALTDDTPTAIAQATDAGRIANALHTRWASMTPAERGAEGIWKDRELAHWRQRVIDWTEETGLAPPSARDAVEGVIRTPWAEDVAEAARVMIDAGFEPERALSMPADDLVALAHHQLGWIPRSQSPISPGMEARGDTVLHQQSLPVLERPPLRTEPRHPHLFPHRTYGRSVVATDVTPGPRVIDVDPIEEALIRRLTEAVLAKLKR
jgi:hypothetical protein